MYTKLDSNKQLSFENHMLWTSTLSRNLFFTLNGAETVLIVFKLAKNKRDWMHWIKTTFLRVLQFAVALNSTKFTKISLLQYLIASNIFNFANSIWGTDIYMELESYYDAYQLTIPVAKLDIAAYGVHHNQTFNVICTWNLTYLIKYILKHLIVL